MTDSALTSASLPQPLKLLRADVPATEIAQIYLRAELGRLLGDDQAAAIELTLQKLDEPEFWRLLEALSLTYRLNAMFDYVTDPAYSWNEGLWEARDLTLTGMSAAVVTRLIRSEAISGQPLVLRDYLRQYFAAHPRTDPEGLNELRPNDRPIHDERLMIVERNGQRQLLDGSHRFVQQLYKGKEQVVALSGSLNGQPAWRQAGTGTYANLHRAYVLAATDAEREAVLLAIELLARHSRDGEAAIKLVWLDYARNEDDKRIGETLLKRVRQH